MDGGLATLEMCSRQRSQSMDACEAIVMTVAVGALLSWVWHVRRHLSAFPMHPSETLVVAGELTTPAGCHDFNASCLPPCPTCQRLSRESCARCHGERGCKRRHHNRSNSLAAPRQLIRWLHFPKCGATFALSAMSYACASTIPTWHTVGMALRGGRIDVRMAHAINARGRKRGTRCDGRLLLPFDGHQPVSARDAGLVAMFRRPSQRLISAYLDNYHAWGLAGSARATIKQHAPTIAAFARFPGIAGCMAKMLSGHHCAADVDLSDGAVLRRALEVLRSGRFAFVGLTEEWQASVCLFHRMLPEAPPPMAAEFRQLGHSVNSHRALDWLPSSSVDGVYNESVLQGFVDFVDEAVYVEAARIFKRNMRVHHGGPAEERS